MSRFFVLLAAIAVALAGLSRESQAMERFVELKSPAGITFWYQFRPDLQKAAVIGGFRDSLGFRLDGKAALHELAHQLLPRGAGQRSANEINEAMKDLGADSRVYGDGWRTYVSLGAAPDKLAAAAEITQDVLNVPRLEAKELERIRASLIDHNKQQDSQADAIALRTALRYAFGESQWSRADRVAGYQAITLEDIAIWRKRILTRDNVSIAASGPMTAEAFGTIVDTLFAGLPEKGDVPAPLYFWFKPQPKTIVVEMPQAQTVLLEMGATDIALDRERLKSSLGAEVLGGGSGSRLFQQLRGVLGATYGINARLMGFAAHDILAIRGAFAHDKAVAALASVDEQYALWQSTGITGEEFEAVRSRSRSGFDQSSARPGDDVQNFITSLLVGRPPNDIADYAGRMAGYTTGIVNADITARFPKAPLVKIIVTPDASLFKADCIIKDWREADTCR